MNDLVLALSHATEVGAIAAARAAGYGDNHAADDAAVTAMREYLNTVDFTGKIVIGEGERDEAPMLYIGEKVGKIDDRGLKTDNLIAIAVDPLENTNATAKLGPAALSVLAAAEAGGLLGAPDMYMQKLIVGPQAAGSVHLDDPVAKTLKTLAKSLERSIEDLVIVVLDRDRHTDLINQIRTAGARVKLVPDGDLLTGVATCFGGSGIHAVMGIGAAPEGVMTAAAVKMLNGWMEARFWPRSPEETARLVEMGGRSDQLYTHETLAPGQDLLFCATGVTTGELLKGVAFFGSGARTHSLIITANPAKVRFIDTTHIIDREKIEIRL